MSRHGMKEKARKWMSLFLAAVLFLSAQDFTVFADSISENVVIGEEVQEDGESENEIEAMEENGKPDGGTESIGDEEDLGIEDGSVNGNEIQAGAGTPANPVHHHKERKFEKKLGDWVYDYTDWSYVYFGNYPQSEVTNTKTIAAIENAIPTSGKTADVGVDVVVNGVRYRRISKEDIEDGIYKNTHFENVTYRYFRWGKIKWRVLKNDGNTLFLMADKVIDTKAYNQKQEDVTWEDCTLRSWLNTDFYNTAFSDNERSAITARDVENEAFISYIDDGSYCIEEGNSTNDKIYLLSRGEMQEEEYGFCKKIVDDRGNESHGSYTTRATSSDYAYKLGICGTQLNDFPYSPDYWMRSSYGTCSTFSDGKIVRDNAGYVYGGGNWGIIGGDDDPQHMVVTRVDYGVRPVLHISLSSDAWTIAKEEDEEVKEEDEEEEDDKEYEYKHDITTGYFKYAGVINKDSDSIADYRYSDSYFKHSATRYNPSLATMSLCLELSTWPSYEKNNWYNPSYTQDDSGFWQDKLYNIKSLLLGSPDGEKGDVGIGFSDFKANDFWQAIPTKDSIGVCAARKKITTSSGKDYTLIALVVRGGGYGAEWASNFTIGKYYEHKGFATARDNVLDFLDSYISSLNLSDDEKNIKIWITGFSRAGATANMVAGALDSYHSLPNGITISDEDIYCYTFEAPQGAVRSTLQRNRYTYMNIFNVLNSNDLVPLVAPCNWDFARYNYQNDRPLPSQYTSKEFKQQKEYMLKEMARLGYADFDYKISEESQMENFKVDKSNILLGGDPLWWFEESKVDTNTVLQEGVNFLAGGVIPDREYYYENLEYCVRQLLGILMDDYGENKLYNYANEVVSRAFMTKLDELFTCENIAYIISPMFSVNPLKSYTDRVKEVKIRLGEKIEGIFAEYKHIEGFIDSVVDILDDAIVQVAKDVWNNNTDSINVMRKFVKMVVSSGMQAHYPEICLAWCRSLDPYYNSALTNGTCYVSRVVRVNCPVDINVYDSSNNLVASIVNDVANESNDGIIHYVNNKGEKLFFLPGDESYTLNIIATDEGKVNYSISEYNFAYQQNTSLQNYYDISVTKDDELSAIVPAISEDELVQNDINGSTAEYQLLHDNVVLTSDEKFTGELIKQEYYEVSLSTEGNGGYVAGAGSFIKGSFAKAEAYLLPNAEFLGWYIDDEFVSSELEYRFAVTEDVTLTAKFSNLTYSNLSFDVDGGGTINAVSGTYADGTKIGIEAVPLNGYEFVEWTSANGGIFEDSKLASTKFTISDKETVVIAHFKLANSSTEPSITSSATTKIESAKISLKKTSYVYDGKKKQPSVTVKIGPEKLKKGTDYKVTYKNNKKVGAASIVITGMGKYTGKVTKKFKIIPKGTSITKIISKSKGFTVNWKKQVQSTNGYQVQYSTSKKFVKKATVIKTVKKSSKTKLNIKNCKAKKKYYVRIRTYKTVKGKKYYSGWSKVKAITIKK